MTKGKFTEGQICEFLYVKNVVMDEEFMVFEDKDRERFLVPFQYYKTYQLQTGKPVKCTITRVDCAGKVTFEPEHPYYKPGCTYYFDFVRMLVSEETEYNPITGKSNVVKDYEIIVADRDGNEHHVVPRNWQRKKKFKTDNLKCRIVKIVKGRFQLTNLEESRPLVRQFIKKIKTKIKSAD